VPGGVEAAHSLVDLEDLGVTHELLDGVLAVEARAAEYLHRVGPFFGFFGVGYAIYCVGQATRRMEASVFAALLRAAIAVLGGLAVVWLKADVTWNFFAVALGMVAFGLVALPPLISRSGYE